MRAMHLLKKYCSCSCCDKLKFMLRQLYNYYCYTMFDVKRCNYVSVNEI